MKHLLLPLSLISLLLACKEEEPFEYPQDPEDIQPSWITETERNIKESENWVPVQMEEGCKNPNVHINNFAAYELNYSRGFATIQLTPDTAACKLEVSLKSNFSASEISSHEWDELNFEFTYSEYEANSGTQLVISLYYKNLELDLDLVPIIEKLVPVDTTSGLVKLSFENDEPVFSINGNEFKPDFSSESGNHYSLSGSGSNQFFQIRMTSTEVDAQSYVGFKYLRISRYGLKDA